MIDERERRMRQEAAQNVPRAVREEIARLGFRPTLDAGNLWFFDRGSYRMTFGEDGTDYPQSLDEHCEIYDMASDASGPVWDGPLRAIKTARFIG